MGNELFAAGESTMSSLLMTKAFAARVHKAREMRLERMMDILAMP